MLTNKKIKLAYYCSQCGAEHQKWQGQCRECSGWNCLIEERSQTRRKLTPVQGSEAVRLPDVALREQFGHKTNISELDRVLGGRLVPGMSVLLGGEPGIGKSTLLLQAADSLGQQGLSVLYVTGEESLTQLRLRADRLGLAGEGVTAVHCTVLDELTDLISRTSPQVVLLDSIQTLASAQFDSPPGTLAQVREVANQLILQARSMEIALILVGHVTKEGLVAGPKVLEHMVDTVVYFEGDQTHLYRLLRVTKNRFGSSSEIGLFQMSERGLVEIQNFRHFFSPNQPPGLAPVLPSRAFAKGRGHC